MRLKLPLVALALAFTSISSRASAAGPYQFYPLAPCRVLDTRGGVPLTINALAVNYTITGGVCGLPAAAKGVILNATAVPVPNSTAGGYLGLWAAGGANPGTSILNTSPTSPIGNGATVLITPGAGPNIAAFYGGSGSTATVNLLLDLVGYLDCPPGTDPCI